MAIDAVISSVTVLAPSQCPTCNCTGKDPESTWDDCPACHGATPDKPLVRIGLSAKPGRTAGQRSLTIMNPPTLDADKLASMIGCAIWGNASKIMVGQTVWAERIGYTKIRLVGDKVGA